MIGSHLREKLPSASTTHVTDTEGDRAEWNSVLPPRRYGGGPGTGNWLMETKLTVETDGMMEAFLSPPASL